MKTGILLAGVVLAVSAASIGTAAAHTREQGRHVAQNATGLCNAMNPANEASLRKFPLGLRNLGPTVNPVACSIPGDQELDANTFISVSLTNESSAELTVNCILVDGDLVYGSESYPQSIILAPGQQATNLWTAASFGKASFRQRSNINCTLPAQVVMSLVSWGK